MDKNPELPEGPLSPLQFADIFPGAKAGHKIVSDADETMWLTPTDTEAVWTKRIEEFVQGNFNETVFYIEHLKNRIDLLQTMAATEMFKRTFKDDNPPTTAA